MDTCSFSFRSKGLDFDFMLFSFSRCRSQFLNMRGLYIEIWKSFTALIELLILLVLLLIVYFYNIWVFMEPQSTVNRSRKWRVWHTANYAIGAVFFLFGSLLLFPYMYVIFPKSPVISAWLYTIGSWCFCQADFTEWTHYEPKVICTRGASVCRFPSFSFNFFLSLIGSIIYFIGSAVFLPQINNLELGLYLFIAGSSFIIVSQGWKVIRVVREGIKRNAIMKTLDEDFTGVLVDLFAGLGGCMYFTGSFLFFKPQATFQIMAAAIFSTGGFFFYLSASFMVKRYFINKKAQDGAISIASSETKVEQEKDKDDVGEISHE